MYTLSSRQVVQADLDRVFPFFAKPENLAVITPPWLDFKILTPSPIPMREGAVIDYQIGLGPLPTRWRTMITSHQPPHLFVDEQLMGPYSFWHHTHRFEDLQGHTLLTDEVRYLPPFGPVGRLVHGLVLRHSLQRIFRHRREFIARTFCEVEGSDPVISWSPSS